MKIITGFLQFWKFIPFWDVYVSVAQIEFVTGTKKGTNPSSTAASTASNTSTTTATGEQPPVLQAPGSC